MLREGESHGSHSKLPDECPRRGIRRMVGNSRLWLPRSVDLNSCVYFSLASLKDGVLWTVHIASKNCKTASKEKLQVSISRLVPSRVGKYFWKLEVGTSKTFVSYMLSGILGEERTQKFQADARFLPDEVCWTAAVMDTKGTHYICLSFSYCESDSSKASRNSDVAHVSFFDEQKLFTDIIQNTVPLNAASIWQVSYIVIAAQSFGPLSHWLGGRRISSAVVYRCILNTLSLWHVQSVIRMDGQIINE